MSRLAYMCEWVHCNKKIRRGFYLHASTVVTFVCRNNDEPSETDIEFTTAGGSPFR